MSVHCGENRQFLDGYAGLRFEQPVQRNLRESPGCTGRPITPAIHGHKVPLVWNYAIAGDSRPAKKKGARYGA